MRTSTSIVLAALVAASSVAAHGKVAVMTGDMGGNGTALGIMGAVIPGPGRNGATEVDTTVFKGKNADGCGKTKNGPNEVEAGTKMAMALSGNQLPMVSPGGTLSGTMHVVTTDGFGSYTALLDQTGTGDFSNAQKLVVAQDVPGDKRGNGKKGEFQKRFESLLNRAGIYARATNVNEDYAIKVNIPADAKCTGTVNGMSNVCMVKLVNPSNAGPFGGCVPIQMGAAGSAPANADLGNVTTEAAAMPMRKERKLRA